MKKKEGGGGAGGGPLKLRDERNASLQKGSLLCFDSPSLGLETATLKRNGSKHDSQITLRISAARVSLFARKHFLSNLHWIRTISRFS